MNKNVAIKYKVRGRLRLVVKGEDGKICTDTGWFDNLITNQGLDMISGYLPPYNLSVDTICSSVAVGTGTTTPTFTDTQLTSPLTYTGIEDSSGIGSYVVGPPAYWSRVVTYSFATGAVVGNIAEVGVGNVVGSSGTFVSLFNHQLIIVSGSPGTISVTSTDQLSVYFELDMYLNTTDTSYSFVMNSVTYSGIYRIANIGTVPSFCQYAGYSDSGAGFEQPNFIAYNGSIGAITTVPSGTASSTQSGTRGTYTNGTYTLAMTSSMSLSQCNVSGGISAFTFETHHGIYQFSCSPPLPKTTLSTIVLNWAVSWARY
jgi:hypothetical protein